MPTLNTLTSAEVSEMGAELASLGAGAQTMEQVANSTVRRCRSLSGPRALCPGQRGCPPGPALQA